MKFYDSRDEKDLTRVESILSRGGIEYSLAPTEAGFDIVSEIQVAEEDVPYAEELLLKASLKR